ncbi:MAG: PmoA family protein, partial [Planctomycetaceae bacterium]|nr:PmoA family protein [Planctomycetaceae bacterium]
DLSGHDFWRNKATIRHLRFADAPIVKADEVFFATESVLLTAEGTELSRLIDRYHIRPCPGGWQLAWISTFQPTSVDLVFGDQEEMGFGVRVATSITEKSGGVITSSSGERTALNTWGQPADWCDYSGTVNGRPAGITIVPGRDNFRGCWWHNRDYGVFVANPFGRAAMKQGQPSSVRVPVGQQFTLRFTAIIHEGADYDPAAAIEHLKSRISN